MKDGRHFVMPEAEAFASGFDVFNGTRFEGGQARSESLALVEEAPLALSYNGQPHAVMLVTPTDLEDFAVGFSLGERIVERPEQVESIDIVPSRQGIGALLRVPPDCMARLDDARRSLAGHGGCGLCGVENLQAMVREPPVVGRTLSLSSAAVISAVADLAGRQRIGAATGAAHAAAFSTADGRIVAVREDAGRHNALDKLIGHLARSRLEPSSGFLVMTSRGSSELALKACTAGFEVMATISAPTGLAVRIAEAAGMTLIGFARETRFTCYAGMERLRP